MSDLAVPTLQPSEDSKLDEHVQAVQEAISGLGGNLLDETIKNYNKQQEKKLEEQEKTQRKFMQGVMEKASGAMSKVGETFKSATSALSDDLGKGLFQSLAGPFNAVIGPLKAIGTSKLFATMGNAVKGLYEKSKNSVAERLDGASRNKGKGLFGTGVKFVGRPTRDRVKDIDPGSALIYDKLDEKSKNGSDEDGGWLSNLFKNIGLPAGLIGSVISKAGLAGGILMGVIDGIMALGKQEEWGTSTISTFLGGFFAGTGEGWENAKGNALKLGLIGSGIGGLVGGPVGMILGGVLGAVLGGILGYIGGERVANFFDSAWAKVKENLEFFAPGAGAAIGGLIGLTIGGPIGLVIGALLGLAMGSVLGYMMAGVPMDRIWDAVKGNPLIMGAAGAIAGGAIGMAVGGPIGLLIGVLLGGAMGAIMGFLNNDKRKLQRELQTEYAERQQEAMNSLVDTWFGEDGEGKNQELEELLFRKNEGQRLSNREQRRLDRLITERDTLMQQHNETAGFEAVTLSQWGGLQANLGADIEAAKAEVDRRLSGSTQNSVFTPMTHPELPFYWKYEDGKGFMYSASATDGYHLYPGQDSWDSEEMTALKNRVQARIGDDQYSAFTDPNSPTYAGQLSDGNGVLNRRMAALRSILQMNPLQQFHTGGIAPNEMQAILRRDEEVLSPAASRRYRDMMAQTELEMQKELNRSQEYIREIENERRSELTSAINRLIDAIADTGGSGNQVVQQTFTSRFSPANMLDQLTAEVH